LLHGGGGVYVHCNTCYCESGPCCQIHVPHSGATEGSGLLGCDAVLLGDAVLLPSAGTQPYPSTQAPFPSTQQSVSFYITQTKPCIYIKLQQNRILYLHNWVTVASLI
jgi:hypothetical protein